MKLAIITISALVLLSSCAEKPDNAELMNTAAALPASLNFTQLGLKVITSGINQQESTMFTLYGNNLALKRSKGANLPVLPAETLALVTWKQQDDKHWFGARIPGTIQAIEMIRTAQGINGNTEVNYQRLEGRELRLSQDTLDNTERINDIFTYKPSVMP
jgi:hypothetical protein